MGNIPFSERFRYTQRYTLFSFFMKSWVPYFLLVDAILFAAVGWFFFFRNSSPPEEKIHYHAGFQVYKDNTLVDFSDLQYMNLRPCGVSSEKEDPQIEKAHLHDGVGDVVHVHRSDALWKDLFQNIKYDISGAEAWKDGQKQENFLTQSIQPNESIVFFLGSNDKKEEKVNNRVTLEKIKQVEQQSESCGADSE